MLSVKVSKNGTTWNELTEAGGYQLIDVKGLNPPKANIITSPLVGLDGTEFQSTNLEQRNIVLTYRLKDTSSYDVEALRRAVYPLFPQDKNLWFRFKAGTKTYQIRGYVESINVDLFTDGETMQISIICPSSYLQAITSKKAYFTAVDNYLAGAITNESDCSVGFTFHFTAVADIDKLYFNSAAGSFEVDSLVYNDNLVVCTIPLEKSVRIGAVNWLNNFSGDFFKLPVGYTSFTINCEDSIGQAIAGAGDGYVEITEIFRGI